MTSVNNISSDMNSSVTSTESNSNKISGEQKVLDQNKPIVTTVQQDLLTASLPKRKWITTSYGSTFQPRRHATVFKLMSYNILSQDLLNIHSDLYVDNDPNTLNWNHRLNCLAGEIRAIQPDILCLQEVQHSHLNDIVQSLKPLDFAEPLYKKRNGSQVDGCAIFFNKKLFQLVDKHFVEYFQPNVQILDRFNVAVIVKLALKSNPDVEFIVSTTHLLYNPRRDDIRLAQVQVLLAELDRLSYHSQKSHPLPIILTGDFNFQQSSEGYQLITNGSIKLDYGYGRDDLADLLLPLHLGITDNCQHLNVVVKNQRNQTLLYASDNEQTPPEELSAASLGFASQPFNSGRISHNLNLIPTMDSTYMASTYHRKWITVDFIFYTKFKRRGIRNEPFQYSPLQLLANYVLPTVRECSEMGPIPNSQIGSDHYSMAAKFVLFDNR